MTLSDLIERLDRGGTATNEEIHEAAGHCMHHNCHRVYYYDGDSEDSDVKCDDCDKFIDGRTKAPPYLLCKDATWSLVKPGWGVVLDYSPTNLKQTAIVAGNLASHKSLNVAFVIAVLRAMAAQ
jgi:hypothetical protein